MANPLDENHLGELLQRWDEMRRDGTEPTPEQLCIDCPELAQELTRRTDAIRALDRLLDRTQPSATIIPRAGLLEEADRPSYDATLHAPRYRRLRLHARGGLGEVYVAQDQELNREVALKEIQDRHAFDPQCRARFLLEAEVTGALEHPGIVPVYGLGKYPDGRPYYAMRFIKGDTLKEAIERFHAEPGEGTGTGSEPGTDRQTARTVAFRGLLRRFLDVCNAIDYAHVRGVLHRDLKPANIIVGNFGETLVVDWGLVKTTGQSETTPGAHSLMPSPDSGSAQTLPGRAIGTPSFMSPEQARGELEAVGPRSDVYSLGATLYCILTGRSPFAGNDSDEVLRRVQNGAFPHPRRIDSALDPALEAICLRAMALRRENRYASCRALGEDVERWLADEPVTAYREPPVRRARRWARRRRSLVTTTSVAVIVAAVGLGAVSAVQTKARLDLASKNSELTRVNLALDLQRRKAEEREQSAIDAVKRFSDVISKNATLKNDPTLAPLRRELLNEPLSFFRTLRDQLQADPDTRPESLLRLGSVAHDLASVTDEIGNKQDALQASEESLAIWEQLARENPTVAKYQSYLARSHNGIGVLQRMTGQNERALESFRRGRDVLERVVSQDPTSDESQSGLAACLQNIGSIQSDTGHPDQALENYRQARSIWEQLTREKPDNTEYQVNLAKHHFNMGLLVEEMGHPDQALESFGEALKVQRGLVQRKPEENEFQRGLARYHNSIGVIQDRMGHTDQAIASYRQAIEIQDRLAERSPSVTEYQRSLSASLSNLAISLDKTGHPAEAARSYRRALEILERLATAHPQLPDFASALGGTLHNIAVMDLTQNRAKEAKARLEEAIRWQKKALAANPKHPTYRLFLTNGLNVLIRAANALNDPSTAADAQRELLELKTTDPSFARLDVRLAAVIRGQPSSDNAERLALAQRAYDRALHATAARLWAEALDADRNLADDRQAQNRYNAACSAALAAAGKGKDDPLPDEAAKTKLRQQALDWLKSELVAWAKLIESGTPMDREMVRNALGHWKVDTDLAGIRDEPELAKLPEAERMDWHALWHEVDAEFKKVAGDSR
jgi:serine/threonine-protein kinase